jgi:hypothetical protein
MKRIASPSINRNPDRFLQCQEAMADEVADVALSAVTAGWQPEEVAAALVELADHMMLGIIATRDLERDISFLRNLK